MPAPRKYPEELRRRAIKLYESFGFEREGYRKGHYLRDGGEADAILMALRLDRTDLS